MTRNLSWRRGFTLIEMLAALLVMGLLVGLVSVTLRPDERGLLRDEAERLAQLLNLATEEARMTGRPVEWSAAGAAYRFRRAPVEGGWDEVRGDDPLRARVLPPGMTVSALRVEAAAPARMRLELLPYGPPLLFTIELSLGRERARLAASPLGEVRVSDGAEAAHDGVARRQ